MVVEDTSLRAPRSADGFTLVELLVVVAIIALLVALLMPSLQNAKLATRRAVCVSQQHQIGVGLRTYAARTSGQVMPPGNASNWRGWGIDSTYAVGMGPMGAAILITENIVASPETFYCPDWKHPYHQYDVLDKAGDDPVGGPNDYGGWPAPGKPGPNRHRGISYHYRTSFGLELEDGSTKPGKPPDLSLEGNPVVLADHWTRRYVLLADWGHPNGYNALHLDGHSAWRKDGNHAFMDRICEFHSHGNWGMQEWIWKGWFDEGGELR